VCQTLSPDGSTFGDCSHRGVTGGSGTVNSGLFFTGGVMTVHWASGKKTRFQTEDTNYLACGPHPTVSSEYIVEGGILKDTTGKITAPLILNLCDEPSGWSLLQPAQF
jgi:hypothetical protein